MISKNVCRDRWERRRVAIAIGEEGNEDVVGVERTLSLLMQLRLLQQCFEAPLWDHERWRDVVWNEEKSVRVEQTRHM